MFAVTVDRLSRSTDILGWSSRSLFTFLLSRSSIGFLHLTGALHLIGALHLTDSLHLSIEDAANDHNEERAAQVRWQEQVGSARAGRGEQVAELVRVGDV